MNTDTFKVVNEEGKESLAEVITAFTYKDKEYVIYSITMNDDNSGIYVSRLVKDNDGNDTICDIEDDQEREEIFKVTEEILASIE